MPPVITFDKGSKRKLRRARWTASERLRAAALFLFLIGFGLTVALWSASDSLRSAGKHWLEVRR